MEWWATTIVIGSGALTLFNVIDKVVGAVKATKNPIDDLKKRVEELERKNEEICPRYDKKIAEIEQGNKVVLNSLLAIMKHDIDGNNIDALKDASEELQRYLIQR